MNEKRYKALRAGLRSQYDGSQWKLGEWRKTECLEPCVGFNCASYIQDTMKYVKMEILAEVEVRGKHFFGDDKETWEEMRVVKAWHWTKKDSVEMAIYCAELVIDLWARKYPDDDRPQKAIQAAKAWVNNPTEENLVAASEAAAAAKLAWEKASAAWMEDRPEWAVEKAAMEAAVVAVEAAKTAKAADAADAAEKVAWAAWAAKEAAWAAGVAAELADMADAAVEAAEKAAGVEEKSARKRIKDVIENWLKQRIETLTPYLEEER